MRSRSCSLVLAAAAALSAQLFGAPAHAQFVCVDGANSAQGAIATGSADNMACGPSAYSDGTGSYNTSVGSSSSAYGDNSGNTATGASASAIGDNSGNTAFGVSAGTAGNNSHNTAVGHVAAAGGDGSENTSIGFSANTNGDNANNTALGDGTSAAGDNSANVAVGHNASASGNGAQNTAVGANANAHGNSVAVGAGATASYLNSAAFGNGATVTRDNQQAFGTASNTYTMAGIGSTASKTAQGSATHLVTSNASGDLAAYTFSELGIASSSDLAGINSRLDGVDHRIDGVALKSDKALQGVAMAFAMAGAPALLPNQTFALSGNWGGYEGKNGVSVGGALKLGSNVQLNGGVAYGVNEGTVGGRAGVSVGW
jgi:hypothetical protein